MYLKYILFCYCVFNLNYELQGESFYFSSHFISSWHFSLLNLIIISNNFLGLASLFIQHQTIRYVTLDKVKVSKVFIYNGFDSKSADLPIAFVLIKYWIYFRNTIVKLNHKNLFICLKFILWTLETRELGIPCIGWNGKLLTMNQLTSLIVIIEAVETRTYCHFINNVL